MKNKKILIHIGYPKTGSTWLQKNLFNNESLGFVSPWSENTNQATSLKVLNLFAFANSFSFDSSLVLQLWRNDTDKLDQQNQDLVYVISREDLVGNPIWSHYSGKEIVNNIYSVFPSAKILIVIREQKSILKSFYREYIKVGGTATLNDFLSIGGQRPHLESPIRPYYFQYHFVIEYYQKVFGKNNVLVLPFELFTNNSMSFCQQILNFLNLDNVVIQNLPFQNNENSGYQGVWLLCKRQLNLIGGPSSPRWIKKIKLYQLLYKILSFYARKTSESLNKKIEEELETIITQYVKDNNYATSNQKSSFLTGIDLKSLGYEY